MPGTKVLDLHVANSINELNDKCEVDLKRDLTIVQLCKSAQKLFTHAELKKIDGDEENAYILYMKYLNLVQRMKENDGYQKNKKIIKETIVSKDVMAALNNAESIKKSLEKRYEDKRQLEKLNEYEKQSEYRQKIDSDREKARKNLEQSIQRTLSFPDEECKNIKVQHLYKLLQETKYSIMIMDTRPREDYDKSHMTHRLCINVPQERIIIGYTPNRIIGSLSHDTINVWNKRKDMDLIVLLDWTSSTVEPGSTLDNWLTALLKWDLDVKYKRKPIILDGGYEAWVLAYPTTTTNPHVSAPDQNTFLDDLLDNIEYPSLMDTPVERKPPVIIPKKSPLFIPQIERDTKFPTTPKAANPMVDRSKKAAAVETYDRKAKEMKMLMEQNVKLANDSFTIEKERIQAEENWEKIHNSHEQEAEEGAKENLQMKKDELVSYLLQLESKQTDTLLEIDQVKNQLAQLKDSEDDSMIVDSNESSPMDESGNNAIDKTAIDEEAKKAMEEALEKEMKIKEIEEEKAEIARRRELLQVEREKKLAEARAQKRLLYKQIEESENEMPPQKGDENISGFKRTHSNINMTQVVGGDTTTEAKIPHFDRAAKPSSVVPIDYRNIQRDFSGVSGSLGRGLTGLKNLGNTCYMNSIMQCLSNTADLAVYFCRDTYREDVRDAQICNTKSNSGTRGAIAEEVAAVVKALWSGQFRFISARDLKNAVGRHQAMFRGCEQQDSHEFLTILMDWLHNDLQTLTRHHIHSDTLPAAEKAWLDYTKSRESLILKLFYGQMKSTLTCLTCGNRSITHDSFSNLSLELPTHAHKCSISDCLELYLQDERISDWNCTSCKCKRDALKKLDISRLPPILVIHFKRFYLEPTSYVNSYKKKSTYIDFPLSNLNMGQYAAESCRNRKNTVYNLYGVSNHYGSMEGGHYTAYCKSNVYSKWYKFDDHLVTEISQSEVNSSAAYILFYSSLPEN